MTKLNQATAARAITSRAPARIDFVGGWTDVQPFCDDEPGLVVNAALTHSMRVEVSVSKDRFIEIESLDYHQTIKAESYDALQYDGKLDLIKAALRRLRPSESVAIRVSGDLPPGSGLGGSGATGVALVGALAAWSHKHLEPVDIARLAHQLEVEELSILGGTQDQYAATFGGFLALTFDGAAITVRQLAPDPAFIRELEQRSVLVFTGHSRLSGDIHQHVQTEYARGEPATVQALTQLRAVARDFLAHVEQNSLDGLGELLSANWEAQKKLHHSVTNAEMEELFQVAHRNGAQGGKALGAGGGGCLYFFTVPGQASRLASKLQDCGAQPMDVRFDLVGLTVVPLAE
jgi:D-glycero-alpha-D-manno-heptose-7-phosphate kinase